MVTSNYKTAPEKLKHENLCGKKVKKRINFGKKFEIRNVILQTIKTRSKTFNTGLSVEIEKSKMFFVKE